MSGVVGCEPVSWLKGVGCGLSSSALSVRGRAVARAGLGSGLCQACIARMLDQSPSMINREIKRNAGTDGCHRGGAYGRTLAHPSQGAHRGCRPCIPDPCLALPRGMRIPPDQRAPQGQGPERVAGVGRHIEKRIVSTGRLDAYVAQIKAHETDPYTVVGEVMAEMLS